MYLGVYALFQLLALLFLFVFALHAFMTVVARSGTKMHNIMLQAVMHAPMAFFSNTDTGSITNRFSQGLQFIDGELPQGLMNLLLSTLLAIGQAILIIAASPYVSLAFPIVLAVFYIVQKVYLRTSRQLRFIDLEAKTPL